MISEPAESTDIRKKKFNIKDFKGLDSILCDKKSASLKDILTTNGLVDSNCSIFGKHKSNEQDVIKNDNEVNLEMSERKRRRKEINDQIELVSVKTVIEKSRNHCETNKESRNIKAVVADLSQEDKLTNDLEKSGENLKIIENVGLEKRGRKRKVKESGEVQTDVAGVRYDERSMKNLGIDVLKDIPVAKKRYILLERIDDNIGVNDLSELLVAKNIIASKIGIFSGANAVASFSRQKDMEKLFTSCQGIYCKSNQLFIFKAKPNETEHKPTCSNLSETSVCLRNLDIITTEADIRKILSDVTDIDNIEIDLKKCLATIKFHSKESARRSIDELDRKILHDKTLRASFLLKSERPVQFMLRLKRLPDGVKKTDIKQVFPTATKVKIIKHSKSAVIHFKSEQEMEAVRTSINQFSINETALEIDEMTENRSQPKEKLNYVVNLFNLPYETTVDEVRRLYPDARFVQFNKNDEGKFIGSAQVKFISKDVCEAALKNTKGLTIKGRKVRSEMKCLESS